MKAKDDLRVHFQDIMEESYHDSQADIVLDKVDISHSFEIIEMIIIDLNKYMCPF